MKVRFFLLTFVLLSLSGCHCVVGTTRCVNGQLETSSILGGQLGPIKYVGQCPDGQHCNRAQPKRCLRDSHKSK